MTLKEILAVVPQYLLPHHLLSRWMAKLTHSQNRLWKNLFIQNIIRVYGVNMHEAKHADMNHYASFNAFFTRELKPGSRPIAAAVDAVASPADGVVSQAGFITAEQLLQAKQHQYSLLELLAGDTELAGRFADGRFATIYLSPKDYHRLHMPLAGRLQQMLHIPGRLFSVNNVTANNVPNLFARNERVVCVFETAAGPMALILVGAIFVCSIETVWHGVVTPPTRQGVQTWEYTQQPVVLDKGAEMGRFNMGSTIIVLFAKDAVAWNQYFVAGQPVKLGEMIGRVAG